MRVGPGFAGFLGASATGAALAGASAFGALSQPASSTQTTAREANRKSLVRDDLWAFIGVGYDPLTLKQIGRV
jgi:hypothetical protein